MAPPRQAILDFRKDASMLGRLGGVLGATWAVLGPSWGRLGLYWGPLVPSWGPLGCILGPLGRHLGESQKSYKNHRFFNDFGLPGLVWGRLRGPWEQSWGLLGHPAGHLESTWTILAHLEAILEPS